MAQMSNELRRRVELHHILTDALGSSQVYYQPPETVKLKYPCIIYFLSGERDWHANNFPYHRLRSYDMTYITKDPDDPMVDVLNDLKYCSFGRSYVSDNLHHFTYSIYY